ncbi:MAG TPA: response regulator [Pyrinomonadaceae bacterium]|nr:response regulator [Pyrinomonadaceae bacterium]
MAKKILIAEDHADIRKMMSIYLKMYKYDVIEAADGYEAVEKAIEHKPDAVLLDLAMPVLDGVDSARAMRLNKELADVPIVCITAYRDFYVDRAKQAGCNAVLSKPIDFSQLDALLKEHMPAA